MTQTLYDKYMQDPEFAAAMQHEDEVMMLTEHIASLEAENAELDKKAHIRMQRIIELEKVVDAALSERSKVFKENAALEAELADRDRRDGRTRPPRPA